MGIDLNAQGDVTVGGDVVGGDKVVQQTEQVASGKYVLQIGSVSGGVVNIAQPGEQPTVKPRPAPVMLRPRPFANLVGRDEEIKSATAAAQSNLPVEFYGEPGLGKTVLLRKLAYPEAADVFPDGVVHLSALNQPLSDLRQSLFDAFYESNPPTVVTEAEVQHGLQGKRALLLLDDVSLSREEVEALLNTAPQCTFIFASNERRLWGDGRALALKGLAPDEGVRLMERELGKDLTGSEEDVAEKLVTALEGKPLHILQAASLARDAGQTLEAVAGQITAHTQTGASPAETVQAQAVAALTEAEQKLLQVLATLNGAPLHADHLAEITGIQDAGAVLENLMKRGLVQAHSPRYSLAGALAQTLQKQTDLTTSAEQALIHFVRWAEANPTAEAVAEAALPMRQILAWAATRADRAMEILRLARALERTLVRRGQWEAWRQVLQSVLDAARTAGDRASEAWALHQLGSRALCLGDISLAQELLKKALGIRQAIGDAAGAATSGHNLQVLRLVLPQPPRWTRFARFAAQPPVIAGAITVVVVAAIAAFGALARPASTPTPTSPPPTFTIVPTSLPSLTPIPATDTREPTRTPAPTDTLAPTATGTDTATPTETPTASRTPTATRRPRITFTPSHTPTQPQSAIIPTTAAPTASNPVQINFAADATTVSQSQCTTLRWSVQGRVQAVYLYGGEYGGPPGAGVVDTDARPACPAVPSTTYTLRAIRGSEVQERSLTISVIVFTPAATDTPAPDTTPPPAPSPISPNGTFLDCGVSPTLVWNPVSDASGIDHYEWVLEYSTDSITYGFFSSGSTAGASDVAPSAGCGYYRWRVRAVDGAGNPGSYSNDAYFGETIG